MFASPDLLDISVLRHAETQSPHLKNAFFEIAAKGAFGYEIGVRTVQGVLILHSVSWEKSGQNGTA